MKLTFLGAALFGAFSLASRLLVASYAGTVTGLTLDQSASGYQLSSQSVTTDCGTNPSWLMLDQDNNFLYCLDEAVDLANGTLTSFKLNPNGSLTKVHQLQTLAGPVHAKFYSAAGQAGNFFAVAHYSGSAVTTYSLDPASGIFHRSQTFTYQLSAPGPVPDRQDKPHSHGVVIDPTGQFVLVPDLGADVVRIFRVNQITGLLEQQRPLAGTPGSGPRHGVFWTPKGVPKGDTRGVRFYLVSELSNDLTGYEVAYASNHTLSFRRFYESYTYGGSMPPANTKVSGISLSAENKHLVVSNRNDSTFGSGNDSIAVFSCSDASGRLPTNVTFSGLYPVHGSFPRQFDISDKDDAVAVALQNSHRVAVTGWNDTRGALGPLLAEKPMQGEIVAAIWSS